MVCARRSITLVPLLCLIASCAPDPLAQSDWPAPAPLGSELETHRPPRDPADASPRAVPQPTGSLTMREALALTLAHHPALSAFAWEIRAREAEVMQSRRWPNPELEFELENFAGSGPFSDFEGSETTLAIGQTILLGGKLIRRAAVAEGERAVAGWEYEAARVGAFTNAASDFLNVLAAQQRRIVIRETAALAEQIYGMIGDRVEAGKISPVERTKAGVERAQAHLALELAEHDLIIARHRLAANWGSDAPTFDEVAGDLERVTEPPDYGALIDLVEKNPDLARWADEMALRRAAVELALAEAVPDLTIRGGVKLHDGVDEHAFIVGASIPIPVFDQNQGNLLAARIRRMKAERFYDAARVQVRSDLAAAANNLHAAFDEVLALRDEIIPSAQSSFDAAEIAFAEGKVGSLDLLDAERTLVATRTQIIDAQLRYHAAVIAVERLIGAPLME